MRLGITEIAVIAILILMFYSPDKAKALKDNIKDVLRSFYETKKELTDVKESVAEQSPENAETKAE